MARHYSTTDFFRQIPNALLARYFEGRGLFGELDFSAMKEGKADTLFEAWLALPDSQRNTMDAEFRDIFALCYEKGFLFLESLSRSVVLVSPWERITACPDPADNKFLEVAVWGEADVIITGDVALLDLHPFRGIPILTPSAFLESCTRFP